MRRITLQSEVIQYLQNYILENDLQAGDKLPSQAQLVQRTEVSLTTIREALKVLEGKGIIEIRNGKGIFVSNGSVTTISTQLEFTREKESILELLEARRILEHEIISLVIQLASEEELLEIETVLNLLMEKYHRGEDQHEIDKQFHYLFYQYCHNRVMQQLMESIDSILEQLWNSPLGMDQPFTSTIPLHKELFEHVKKRNIRKAQAVNDRIIRMDMEEVRSAGVL